MGLGDCRLTQRHFCGIGDVFAVFDYRDRMFWLRVNTKNNCHRRRRLPYLTLRSHQVSNMSSKTPPYRVGREEFETDTARLQAALDRFDEGKGLIGGDPSKRSRWIRPLPEEPAPVFRLHQSSAEHLSRLAIFVEQAPIEIEIGSGHGEFILDWANQHRDRHFIAFEVKWKLMRRTVKRAHHAGLPNLWVSDDDARYDLPRLLEAGSVDVFHVLFPDPWWKPKHQPRRLFVPPVVDIFAGLLRPGGFLRVATDVPGYGDVICDVVEAHPRFQANEPALAEQYANARPTSRQVFCDEVGRPYQYYYFMKRIT